MERNDCVLSSIYIYIYIYIYAMISFLEILASAGPWLINDASACLRIHTPAQLCSVHVTCTLM